MQRGRRDQTTGQAPQRDQGAQGRDAQQDKGQPQRSQRNREQTTGQGERQQGQSPSGTQRDQSQTQTPQRQQGQQGQTGAAPQGQDGPSQAQQGKAGGGNVTLTTEQRTRIRETVLVGRNAPRASNVNFSLSVGTVVPRSVRVVAVPRVIVDVRPEWRGYLYFVVDDQIIIVDRNHRIVAVLVV
jgi:hypothetical protein